MNRGIALLTWLLLSIFLVTGCQTAAPDAVPADQRSGSQIPQLKISTTEIIQILTGPEANNYFIVDTRPEAKYNAGHVPGAISIPKSVLTKNINRLPPGKTIVFYCGGLSCRLSTQAAEIALNAGVEKVKIWYEGMPGWVNAGYFSIIETKGLEKIVMQPQPTPYLLIDTRPATQYQQSFIPSALSLPQAEFELKKGLLPAFRNIPLIFYCDDDKCSLSHQSANLALDLGYQNVAVYAAGQTAWEKAKLPLWGNTASAMAQQSYLSRKLPEEITVKDFKNLVAAGEVTIVDVRPAEDYARGHIPGAIHIFDEDFIFKTDESIAKLPESGRVIFHCATGMRATDVYDTIRETSDYGNIDNLQYLDAEVEINEDGSFSIESPQ